MLRDPLNDKKNPLPLFSTCRSSSRSSLAAPDPKKGRVGRRETNVVVTFLKVFLIMEYLCILLL